ncbi:MAG: PEP-CTERM sorting domain-containing protein, partial [Burkholderiales bacterium]|nr:PEP-CTERM sorting domain-containing protein [Burkholderiales bacterium]
GDGQELRGYGSVDRVNGNINYGVAGARLFFVFDDYISTGFSASTVGFLGGEIRVYIATGADASRNLLDFDSETNFAWIEGLTEWVGMTGHDNNGLAPGSTTLDSNGNLTGASISFSGSGLLDIDTTSGFGDPAVAAFLDANTLPDNAIPALIGGFADVAFTSSGNNFVLNQNDVCTGVSGEWCIQGTANLRGKTVPVPEPGSIALLGATMVGMGFVARKHLRAKK